MSVGDKGKGNDVESKRARNKGRKRIPSNVSPSTPVEVIITFNIYRGHEVSQCKRLGRNRNQGVF